MNALVLKQGSKDRRRPHNATVFSPVSWLLTIVENLGIRFFN